MYKVKTQSLAAVITQGAPIELVPPGKQIAEIFCIDIPPGATFDLLVGNQNTDYITITKSFAMEPRGDFDSNYGLYLANPIAQAATSVQVVVVFGDDQSRLNPVT